MAKKVVVKIAGMHCASCEVLIERRFRKIPGVEHVKVSHASEKAVLRCSQEPDITSIQDALHGTEYVVATEDSLAAVPHDRKRHYLEIGAVFLILFGVYLFLKRFDLLPQGLGISDNMSYGFVILLGMVASASTCLAVTGGLIVAAATKYNDMHPELTGKQKFRPHIYFNIGRIASYTLFGGLVGTLGSILTLSSHATGIMTVLASAVMVLLGLQMLHLFPWLNRFQPKMPKFLAHKIHDASGRQHKAAPFLLGGATFFLPCGFTQALQIYVLSKGDFITGALIMLAFSLGTLPGLLSIGAISSFAKGTFRRYFTKFVAVLVIMLGVFSIGNGLTLAGFNLGSAQVLPGAAATQGLQGVEMVDGAQVVRMKVVGLEYSPSRFTVLQGVPVRWEIDGTRAAGCGQVITVPSLGITEYLPRQGTKTITFTPAEVGTIQFSCTMGMTTRGAAFEVVPNPDGVVAPSVGSGTPADYGACDPAVAECNVQRLQMEISRERGFYPNVFTVKKGVPVELEIDAKIQLGGCMGTMIIPEYNIAHRLSLGKTTLRFTPTETGVVPFTCSMGSRMGQFTVV